MTDGLERLALAYGWPPAVGQDMDPGTFAQWVQRADRVLKTMGGVTRR